MDFNNIDQKSAATARKIQELEEEIIKKTKLDSFELNMEVVLLQKEIRVLQAQCLHRYVKDGFCLICNSKI